MATANAALRNSQADDLVANLDKLEVLDGSGTTLVTFTLAWNGASSGTTDVSGLPITESAAAGGTASTARLYDSGSSGQELSGMSVTQSGGDVTIDNTSITAGQDVELQSLDFTIPTDLVA